MQNKELIIQLIQQDLKHHQLLLGLEQIGLHAEDTHHLKLLSIIAQLMQVPQGEIDDEWSVVYVNYMQEATRFKITATGETLLPLATACYGRLRNLLDNEE